MSGGAQPVLTMANVTATLADARFSDVEDISFDIATGQCVSIALENHRDSPLPGFAIGERIGHYPARRGTDRTPSAAAKARGFLSEEMAHVSMSGRVLFEGVSWEYRSTYGLLACRGRIGWVLSRPAWVNNLNVLENVLLRPLHHTTIARSELLAQAQELAYAVGLPEVPIGRMNALDLSRLRRAEWVRAFLGGPRLVMLHRAFDGIESTHHASLTRMVREAMSQGIAILWITGGGNDRQAANEVATRRYQMDGPRMIPAETKR